LSIRNYNTRETIRTHSSASNVGLDTEPFLSSSVQNRSTTLCRRPSSTRSKNESARPHRYSLGRSHAPRRSSNTRHGDHRLFHHLVHPRRTGYCCRGPGDGWERRCRADEPCVRRRVVEHCWVVVFCCGRLGIRRTGARENARGVTELCDVCLRP
jgi:hypothetical protein